MLPVCTGRGEGPAIPGRARLLVGVTLLVEHDLIAIIDVVEVQMAPPSAEFEARSDAKQQLCPAILAFKQVMHSTAQLGVNEARQPQQISRQHAAASVVCSEACAVQGRQA